MEFRLRLLEKDGRRINLSDLAVTARAVQTATVLPDPRLQRPSMDVLLRARALLVHPDDSSSLGGEGWDS
jgi:hypothetical protein